MDARAYLRAQRSRIRAMEIRIEMQMERESRLRSRLSRSTALADGMPRSGGGEDAMARGMAELEALEREIGQSLGALADMKRRLEEVLAAIPDEFQRMAAQLKYADGLTYEAMAERMDISVRWAYVLIGRAMEALSRAGVCDGANDRETA